MKKTIYIIALLVINLFLNAQETKTNKDDNAIKEVVTLEVERAKYAPKPAPTPTVAPVVEEKGKKKKKTEPVVVEAPIEEAAPDTLPSTMPAPLAEIVKRAQAWYNLKNLKFEKTNGTNTGSNMNCTLTFTFKQKVLNPENDVDGKISMSLTIEAKEGKYRYIIKDIKHKANKPGMNGGDVYAKVPECGSMKLNDITWKHIKSESLAFAKIVSDDVKTKMKEELDTNKDEW